MSQLKPLLDSASRLFRDAFATAPAAAAAAPGRVNLIGEHTDYNGGFVLPMAIDRHTVAVAGPTDGDGAAVSDVEPNPAVLRSGGEFRPGTPAWANYVRGVLAGFAERGTELPPLNIAVASDLPIGAGLSSSAGLEAAVATVAETLLGVQLDPLEKALLCRRAENEFAGAPCGIMDQYVVIHAEPGRLVLLDCAAQTHRLIPLNTQQAAVLIADTRVKHSVGGGEYGERRAQCEQAAAALGAATLREVALPDLEAARASLPDVVYRRARHVVTEIARTAAAAEALAADDLGGLGKLMAASHVSMRDDFEISCPEVEAMVAAFHELGKDGGVHGARLTGGGFGGCVVAVVDPAEAPGISERVAQEYRAATGIESQLFVTQPVGGAEALSLTD
jgi:galactokinase